MPALDSTRSRPLEPAPTPALEDDGMGDGDDVEMGDGDDKEMEEETPLEDDPEQGEGTRQQQEAPQQADSPRPNRQTIDPPPSDLPPPDVASTTPLPPGPMTPASTPPVVPAPTPAPTTPTFQGELPTRTEEQQSATSTAQEAADPAEALTGAGSSTDVPQAKRRRAEVVLHYAKDVQIISAPLTETKDHATLPV